MSEPKTLLQMAGADLTPAKLSQATVVIIDAQEEYVSGKLPLDGVAAALDNIAKLLSAARAAGAPVIHIRHRGGKGGAFDPDGSGFAFAAKAAPAGGEKIIDKTLPNSFAKTSLQLELQATGRKALVLAGFMTHMCISATARSALDHGYQTTVAGDAAATRALPDPLGGVALSAAEIHRTALAELADRFAIVARTADIKA